MKRVSERRRKLNAEVGSSLQALIDLVEGNCEWCMRPGTDEHHIANGHNRGLSLGLNFARLWLCRACHDDLHEYPKPHAVCIALALLRYSRSQHYDLEAYYKLTARRWPDESMIDRYWRRMLAGKTTATAYGREFPNGSE